MRRVLCLKHVSRHLPKRVKMMHGAVTVADLQLIGRGDGAGDVALGGANGLDGIGVVGKQGGDGGGERAAGAVGVLGERAWSAQFVLHEAVVHDVDAFGTVEMSSLEHDNAGAKAEEGAGGVAHLVNRGGGRAIEKHGGFGQVGREDFGQRQDLLAQRGHGFAGQEVMPAFGHHDRIDDEPPDFVPAQSIGHGGDGGRVTEHAKLGGVNAHVGEEGIQLPGDKINRDGLHSGDSLCALRGERGDDRSAIGSKRRECFYVGQDARAS